MKKIWAIALLLNILGCGTDQGGEKKYDYTIINNSGARVELVPFINGVNRIDRKITLENGAQFNKKHTDYPIYNNPLNFILIFTEFSTLGGSDQIEITFNNTKKIIYNDNCVYENGVSLNCSANNIFLTRFNDERTEVYTITPEDFQNAEDCGGNCN
ncbi:MAG TPA: hypothetical protein VF677_00860 [Flavobacterium sp.]|jgi:hypothetical protein